MLQAVYRRDAYHNYLVLQNNMETEPYQTHMVLSNSIKGLLKCSIRNINDRADFYYEISSKQTVERIYEFKKITYNQLLEIVNSIKNVFLYMKEYLLEEQHLTLKPEFIYMNMDSKEIELCFYPEYDVPISKAFTELAEFFLDKINHEEEKAVILAYQFYKSTKEDNFQLQDFIEKHGVLITNDKEDSCKENINLKETEGLKKEEFDEETDTNLWNASESKKVPEEKKKYRYLYYVIGTLFIMTGGAVIILLMSLGEWIMRTYQFTGQAYLVILSCAIVLVFLGIFIMIPKKKTRIEVIEIKENMEVDSKLEQGNFSKFLEEPWEEEAAVTESSREGYGETVLLRESEQINTHSLSRNSKGKKIVYELNQFPYSIGKVEDCVDLVIKDPSISRLHARLYEENNKIFLMDLNSTNGTFKNGLILDTNEVVEVKSGDEISFADVTFVYR